MNTQNNTPASRNEEAVATSKTDDANFVQAIEYAAQHGWPTDVHEWLERIASGVRARALAAPGAAIDAREQEATVPDGWCIDREPRNVLALYRTGTAQPYRFAPGEAVHAFLLALLGGCPECGGRLEFEEGEAWDGPSVGCVECGNTLASREEAPAASAQDFSGDFVEHSHPQFGAGFFCTPDVFERITSAAPSEAISPATVAQPVGHMHTIAGLGRKTDEDDGFVTLQFVDEKSAEAFMADYACTVEVDEMPPIAQPCASQGCGGAADREDHVAAELKLPPEIVWPKDRDVGRIGDMAPGDMLRVGFDGDNDVSVGVYDEHGGAVVEFCTPGPGGGKSSRTRRALIALMVAMEADNAEDPGRDWWARRAQKDAALSTAKSGGGATPEGGGE